MLNEKDIISKIFSILPAGDLQVNKPFESDCEILKYENKFLLFTTDEYSKEDRIRENDPFVLGYNLAVASVSDILACGGIPKFYAHSMVVNDKWDQNFIMQFSLGIKKALECFEMSFIGGDFGCGAEWHYTTSVIGETDKILMRKGAMPDDLIYITGAVGVGNLEAALSMYSENKLLAPFLNQYKTEFNIRYNESKLIKKYATSCIDTSDGLCKSLNYIAEINDVGFEIKDIPYHKTALIVSNLLKQPKEMLMIGECGEYELLFTIPPGKENSFLEDARLKQLQFCRIGMINKSKSRELTGVRKSLDLSIFNISAREYKDIKGYIEYLNEKLKTSWKEKGL